MIKKAKLKRIEVGKTQIQLQVETGIPTSLISLYEREIIKPSPKHAQKLNEALNCTVYDESRRLKKIRRSGRD